MHSGKNRPAKKAGPTGAAAGGGAPAAAGQEESPAGRPWPPWACWLVSGLLLFHIVALLVYEAAGPPNYSGLEDALARQFWWYIGLIDQEYTHRYFAPEPDAWTPVLTVQLQFGQGRPNREIRVPDPATRPRIRYLRQIALVWHLMRERTGPDLFNQNFIWAESYARHWCRTNPGCTRVLIYVRRHEIPQPDELTEAAARGENARLDSGSYFSYPELLGDFACRDQ